MTNNGKIRILDTVFKEITQKDSNGNRDELAEWAFGLFEDKQLSHKTDKIGAAYVQVQDYLATCGLYREASYRQWEPETKADPWLIAAAMVEGAIVVTNEQAAHPMLSNPLKKEPKIPDVADAMGVDTMSLREFYDASGELVPSPYPPPADILILALLVRIDIDPYLGSPCQGSRRGALTTKLINTKLQLLSMCDLYAMKHSNVLSKLNIQLGTGCYYANGSR